VVLPTRDRPQGVLLAVQSILTSTLSQFEIIVVDQSRGRETADLLASEIADKRVRVLRDEPGGSSRARNVGAAMSQAALIAFTDDDCQADSHWLMEIVDAFDSHPRAGIACGAVDAAPHDSSRGFIVGYPLSRSECLSGRLAKLRDAGIGANMAVRVSVLAQLGGWDELLGAGSAFDGAGDLDLVYRALVSGFDLLHLPAARTCHFGFRDWSTGRDVIRGRFRGVGAAYTKHLRSGDPVAALLLAQQLWTASTHVVSRACRLRRPLGLGRLWSLCSGIWDSLAYPVDQTTRLYYHQPFHDLHRNQTYRRVYR
jgi:GT2 family glycosyltransferase